VSESDTLNTAYLQNIARDLAQIRTLLTTAINATTEAESEVPEKIRRFAMYMHDIHDMLNFYREGGHEAPEHVKREAERCDDRLRHLLEDLNTDTGAFERIRQEMTQRPGNRWDHSRLLPKTGE
jgi:hypothetical protein